MSGRALLLAPLATLSLENAAKAEDMGGKSCDVIVIGASPSGIAAAVAARREGSSVVLVEELRRVGGMYTAGGMGLADCFFMDRRMLDGLCEEIHSENLLVPVYLSALHVALGSIRVEPTWIVLGQTPASPPPWWPRGIRPARTFPTRNCAGDCSPDGRCSTSSRSRPRERRRRAI